MPDAQAANNRAEDIITKKSDKDEEAKSELAPLVVAEVAGDLLELAVPDVEPDEVDDPVLELEPVLEVVGVLVVAPEVVARGAGKRAGSATSLKHVTEGGEGRTRHGTSRGGVGGNTGG